MPSVKSPVRRRRRADVPALTRGEADRLLSRRGPHHVKRGDLGIVGTAGVVYTPEAGFGLPAIAFAHGWLTGVGRYTGLFEHLASHGIVVIAPNTRRGFVPSHLDLAHDLLTALDVATGTRLGDGRIGVDPGMLGLVGHGMGGSVAVIAAARRPVATVAALFPAPSAPAAEDPAAAVTAPALVVAGERDIDSPASNARKLAAALAGETHLRLINGASQAGLVEGRQASAAVGIGGREKKTITTTRALLTGYLLYTLTGDGRYRTFVDDTEPAVSRTKVLDRFEEPEPPKPPTRLDIARALIGK